MYLASLRHNPSRTAETVRRESCAQLTPSEVWRPLAFLCNGERLAIQQSSNFAGFPGCVLRISHPLDAFRPPQPTELISSRIRLWGLPSEVSPLDNEPYVLSNAAALMELAQALRPDPLLQGLSLAT
jgi:hypothetical protein